MGGWWDGFLDITGDVIEFALPTVGTLFGPGGRLIGGALGNLIDETMDGDIHGIQDVVNAGLLGAGEAWLGGMVGGLATRGAAKLVPAVGKMDMSKGGLGLTGTFMKGRMNTVLAHPIEIGKGIGASGGLLAADIIRGPGTPAGATASIRPEIPVRWLEA